MTTELPPTEQPPDALDELIDSLLECGAILSQIIASMVEWDASGRTAPDAAPIPEVAHSLIRSVAKPVAHGYSKRDIKVAAKIVARMTDAMAEDIFAVDPEWFDAITAEAEDPGPGQAEMN